MTYVNWSVFYILLFSYTSKTIFCNNLKTDLLRQTKFPPCKACKIFVESFKKGMALTATGKFEGGDAAWEEEKLRSYAKSEVRLTEIQEKICMDIEEGRDQCYSLNEKYDDVVEDWWFNRQDSDPDIYKYFCIETVKDCCPDFHFGLDCLPCIGYPYNICNKNGKCKGSGTRKGNGKCNCFIGYAGDDCGTCAALYFESYKDETKLLCSKCHVSCQGNCTRGGPSGCENCANGWVMNNEKGCMDVNECVNNKPVCGPLQFCVNNEGSYNCLECDHSCSGCTGDGPDMCINCANGFTLIDNICVDTEQEQRKRHVFLTRYLTYLGLCIATCIILQRNVMLAAIIGLAVAVYISVSEYILNSPPTINATDVAQNLRL